MNDTLKPLPPFLSGRYYKTSSGYKAYIFNHDPDNQAKFRVLGCVWLDDSRWISMSWTPDGKWSDSLEGDPYDLVDCWEEPSFFVSPLPQPVQV